MAVTTEDIYREVFAYCRRTGLIKQLKKSFGFSEGERFNKLRISKDGLHLLDAVHCVYDKKRTAFFLKELDRQVTSQSVVLEAGIGTGILAFFAATRTPRVYGFEINSAIFKLAEDIKKVLEKKKLLLKPPSFLFKDATKLIPSVRADVIISENIYTGMFFEKQVQIINNLLPHLKRGGVVIPHKMHSFVVLSDTKLPENIRSKDLFVPSPERKISFKSRALAKPKGYDTLDFKTKSPRGVKKTLAIPVERNGTLNSLVIYSEVVMPSGVTIKRKDTTFLNSDIILALKPALKVKRGDILNLRIAYLYGGNPKDADISIKVKSS